MNTISNSSDENCKYSTINDAIHGTMYYSSEYNELVKDIIDSAIFQRLRHIKQLGIAELVFPTAVHDRFSHCLGTAYIAYKFAKKLGLEKPDIKYVITSALLHDIGHGPFSHTFEKLFQIEDNGLFLKHEDWTGKFIKELEPTLIKHDIDHNKLINIIEKTDNKDQLIKDIISSQIDADRLDYLLRDSYFCGVPYGNHDLDWIINNVIKIDEAKSPPRLGFLEKGTNAIEHFLLCRRAMHINVYNHHTILIFTKLLVEFLKEIVKMLIKNNNNEIESGDIYCNVNVKKFLKNIGDCRETLEQYKKMADNLQIAQSKKSFLEENYSYYKTMTDYDIWMLIRDFANIGNNGNAKKIAKLIYNRNGHKSFKLKNSYIETIKHHVEEIKKDLELEDWQFFVEEPDITMYKNEQNNKIFVLDKHKRVSNIKCYSYLINLLEDKRETTGYLAIASEILQEKNKKIKDKLKKYIIFDD